MEPEVEKWWNENKGSLLWNGGIIGVEWDDLWDGAKEELREIYRSAKYSG